MGMGAWTDRGALRSSVCVAAVRVARSSPAATLSEAAAAGGCTHAQMIAALRNLPARGRCAQLAAGSVMSAGPAVSRFATPPTKRTTAGELPADTKMAGSASWAGRSALHAGAPRRLLTRLASDTDPELRRVSASSVVCPSMLLERLADDDQAGHAARLNPAMRPAALRRLAVHSRWVVRAGVAENPACSSDLVDSLTEDPSEVVRQAAAANPNISEGVLQRIVYSHEDGYHEDDSDNEDDLEAWRGVASNPACPPALLCDHAEKYDAGTLLCLASNPAASDELLERLTGDCCPEDYYYEMQEVEPARERGERGG